MMLGDFRGVSLNMGLLPLYMVSALNIQNIGVKFEIGSMNRSLMLAAAASYTNTK